MKCQISLDIYGSEVPAFRPAALLHRTSVFAFGENLGTGQIRFTRVFEITEGWSSSLACETQKERHDVSRVFLFGGRYRT